MKVEVYLMFLVICGSGLFLSEVSCGKLGSAYLTDKHVDKHKDMSSETILLRDKLNLILDAESKEVNLLKNLLDEEEDDKASEETEQPTATKTTTTEKVISDDVKGLEKMSPNSVKYLREHGIVTKLEENSKRMEKMVIFFVDLRNLLTEALVQQNKQIGMESEFMEMREEMEYLRKEIRSLKNPPTAHHQHPNAQDASTREGTPSPINSSIENQLHNEHVTLEWLKSSNLEMHRQISELSDQCNVTLLMSLREKMDSQERNRDDSLQRAERQLNNLRLQQLKQSEELNEAKTNIEDLRNWQVKMGSKIVKESEKITENEETNEVEIGDLEGERHFITEELKEAVGKPNLRHDLNHKRLKFQVHRLQTLFDDLLSSNKDHETRLSKIENSQRTLKSLISSTSHRRSQRSMETTSSHKLHSLQNTMEEYILTLEQLNDKVSGMDEIQESTAQLFQSLEQLEKKYDDRVGEMQTGLARLESGMSGVLVTNQDLKEQQAQQSSVIQAVKKDLVQVKGSLQTNHLRLATVQSQMMKWASAKCSDENSESIQNIRIATLENALLDTKINNEDFDDDDQDENM